VEESTTTRMKELDHKTIKTRSLRGIVALIQQSFLIQLTGIVSFGLLAAILKEKEIGLWGVVNSIIAVLTYFSDIGLAGALIQKKEQLTRDDLVTTFTIQQILAIIIVVFGFLATPFFQSFYHLDQSGLYLFWALTISFFLSSFKTIPGILLERKLEFHKMVIPQIIETLVFNGIVVVLAFKGMGILSFAIAAIARSISGLIAIYILSPWRPGISISKNAAKHLFKFGIPYQSISLLALVKDDLLFLFLGKILPLEAMGYIVVAKKFAEVPLRTIMDNVMRVTFPAFSRLQNDTKTLVKAIENTLFGISALLFPIYLGLVVFIGRLFELIPRYHKWEPAMLMIYFVSITSIAASFSSPLTNAMSAVGKIRITLLFMVLWLCLSWIFVIVFVPIYGYNGFGLSLLLTSATVFLVIWITKREIPFSLFQSIKAPFFGVIVQYISYALILPFVPVTWFSVITVGAIGVILYAGVVLVLDKEKLVFISKGILGR
jgi:O-antigen/teichoic acid export membrane protein